MSAPPILPNPIQERTDRDQLRLLMIFHFIYGGLSLFGLVFLCLHYSIMSMVFTDPNFVKPPMGPNFPMAQFRDVAIWFYAFFGAMQVVSLLLNISSGFFLRRRQHRTYSLVVAGLNCIHFPFGTALGVFTFIVLLRDSVRNIYAESSASSHTL